MSWLHDQAFRRVLARIGDGTFTEVASNYKEDAMRFRDGLREAGAKVKVGYHGKTRDLFVEGKFAGTPPFKLTQVLQGATQPSPELVQSFRDSGYRTQRLPTVFHYEHDRKPVLLHNQERSIEVTLYSYKEAGKWIVLAFFMHGGGWHAGDADDSVPKPDDAEGLTDATRPPVAPPAGATPGNTPGDPLKFMQATTKLYGLQWKANSGADGAYNARVDAKRRKEFAEFLMSAGFQHADFRGKGLKFTSPRSGFFVVLTTTGDILLMGGPTVPKPSSADDGSSPMSSIPTFGSQSLNSLRDFADWCDAAGITGTKIGKENGKSKLVGLVNGEQIQAMKQFFTDSGLVERVLRGKYVYTSPRAPFAIALDDATNKISALQLGAAGAAGNKLGALDAAGLAKYVMSTYQGARPRKIEANGFSGVGFTLSAEVVKQVVADLRAAGWVARLNENDAGKKVGVTLTHSGHDHQIKLPLTAKSLYIGKPSA